MILHFEQLICSSQAMSSAIIFFFYSGMPSINSDATRITSVFLGAKLSHFPTKIHVICVTNNRVHVKDSGHIRWVKERTFCFIIHCTRTNIYYWNFTQWIGNKFPKIIVLTRYKMKRFISRNISIYGTAQSFAVTKLVNDTRCIKFGIILTRANESGTV